MKKLGPTTLASVALAFGLAQSALADAVNDWNAIAVRALQSAAPPRPGPVAILDVAVVQAAVYDAVQAIDRRYEPYHTVIKEATGSPVAAAAKAAHDVLASILPGQAASLDATYQQYLVDHGVSPDDPGIGVGEQAAAGILALRADDGRVPNPLPPPFRGGTEAGQWRPTPSYQTGPPPPLAPMATPWLGEVPCFTIKGGDQFRAKPPPDLSSKRYARNYDEVKALGARFNSARTPEQTDLAYFYGGNLVALLYQTLRGVADANVDNIGDSARLLALATMTMADGSIAAWDSKSHYLLWRPVTAIQEGDNDGNFMTVGDPTWEPFLNTPPYPDYTSGANNVTAAMTQTLALFFKKNRMTFTATSDHPQVVEKTRTYHRFSEMARDMVNVRIYQGIHFRFADETGRQQGMSIARFAFKNLLRPLASKDEHEDEDEEEHEHEDDSGHK